MKKVFSLVKYVNECKSYRNELELLKSIQGWVSDCVGLTADEMRAKGYGTCDLWMIEVEEELK